ncbi:MAG TPA: thermonuclease family protein [Candidatus Absconditabacterales bacterium]|nr:thermonuclease family protein [Candidatus Absconditabacterales bacterium]
MKKFLSISLSVFISINYFPFSVFAEDVGSGSTQNPEISPPIIIQDESLGDNLDVDDGLVQDDFGSSDSLTGEIPDDEPDLESLITNGGQSGQVLDINFDTGSTDQNTGEIGETSFGSGQDGQVSEPILIQSLDFNPPAKDSTENSLDLIISEVFFDGFNERIEIYNFGSSTFSGDLVISGASASNKIIHNLVLSAGEVSIFTDTNVDSILDTSNVFQTDMGFSISDSQDMNIEIIYSGQVLDSFVLGSSTVSSIANGISFHKYKDTNNIVESDSFHNFNTNTGILANPGQVYDEIVSPSEPELIITEVYFDGDDEWFEITNLSSQDFSGQLLLSGSLTFSWYTNIPADTSIVFANDIYSMFQTSDNIQTISGIINFDTGAINFDLIRSGQILDNFYAHETQVQYYDQAETSFEKIGSDSSRTTTVVGLNRDRYYNVNWGIAANPTTYFTTGENLIDVTQIREEVSYDQTLPIDCDDFRDTTTANITEVYYGNDLYTPYVEIRAKDNIYDYYPYIMLEGSAVSGAVVFDTYNDIEMDKDKRIILSADDQRYSQGREAVYDSNFSLTTGGRLILYGRDDWSEVREILDIIYLNGPDQGNSLYNSDQTNQCADIFDYQDKFSPGLTIGQSQFIDITPDPIVQYISVGGGGCSSNRQVTFNSKNNLSQEIQISAVKYFSGLQILKLKNKTDSDINLRNYSIQSLDGSSQTVKGNTLFGKSTMSFVGDYGFPTNQDYCINLLHNDDVVDRYCRNSMSKASQKDEENIQNQLSFRIDEEEIIIPELPEIPSNPLQTNQIKITHIDYNPDGSDKDNETITLLLLSGGQIDLSDYTIQYVKDGKSTNKTIQGILSAGNEQIFKGNYTFPNSTNDKNPVTVNLIDPNNYIVDTYIYNPNKITEIPDGDYEVVSVIDGDTVKISYAQKEFNIRLAGIDAPESSTLRCGKVECYGPEAKTYLKSLLEGKTISFQQESTDSFDRFVGYIFLDGENINQKMIREGYAREYSYKDQSYKYQSDFQSSQQYAQNNNLGIRGDTCNGQRLCPVQETNILQDYLFTIENIVYDPDGADTGNEEIEISMQKGFTVDFADGFYLMINNTKRYLRDYGLISPGETRNLKGSFSFPNSKKTTVSLFQEETQLDTYVYDPNLDKLLQEELTGTEISQNPYLDIDLKITSVLPNPLGKDSLGEEIGLLYLGQFTGLDLSTGFYLQKGNTKKYLQGTLYSNQETTITGNFSLPNKAGCVEIGYENHIYDKFCYTEPEEGQKFTISNGVLSSISTIDFDILNNSKLENIGNQVCLTHGSQKFYCKNMPYSKLSTKKVNQNKLYKEFFDSFENYLKDQRKIMYYDTDIKNYFNLLNEIEKAISDGKSTFTLDGKIFQTSEFQAMYETKFPQSTSYFVQDKLSDLIPAPVMKKYQDLKQEYIDYLMRQQ